MVAADRSAEWCEWELQALLRLAHARKTLDASGAGDGVVAPHAVDAIARLTTSAARCLRLRDQILELAA
jgi:bifunctional ADP-heptose synthase (sugar kinase/adenylyltransferase)